jgi:WD40 repeat protein
MHETHRKRALLYIMQFLAENNLHDSLETLQQELLQGDGKSIDDLDDFNNEFEYSALPANQLLQAVAMFDEFNVSQQGKAKRDTMKAVEASFAAYESSSEKPISKLISTHDYIHASNLLTCKINKECIDSVSSENKEASSSGSLVVVTAAADRNMKLTNLEEKKVMESYDASNFPSPILSMDFHPFRKNILLASCMNGSVLMLNCATQSKSANANANSTSEETKSSVSSSPNGSFVLQKFKYHQKYVVSCLWSPCGTYFASASHDQNVCVFAQKRKQPVDSTSASISTSVSTLSSEDDKNKSTASEFEYVLVKELLFKGQVEAITWMKPKTCDKDNNDYNNIKATVASKLALIVSVRNDNYLHKVDISSSDSASDSNNIIITSEPYINMNSNGDDFVSFTALCLKSSPCGQHLIAAVDKHMILMFHYDTKLKVKTYYGAENDGFSNPKLCFSPSGKYIYCTSQDHSIVCFNTCTEKVANVLFGHKNTVKDIDIYFPESKQKQNNGDGYHDAKPVLVSVSFDKTLKMWSLE